MNKNLNRKEKERSKKQKKKKKKKEKGKRKKDSKQTSQQSLGGPSGTLNGRFTIIHNNTISQIGSHNEIVLHNKTGLLGVEDEPLDDLGGNQTLERKGGEKRRKGRVNVRKGGC